MSFAVRGDRRERVRTPGKFKEVEDLTYSSLRKLEEEEKRKMMKKLIARSLVRWLLTAILITIVWRHSHWSVALSISLLATANEVDVFTDYVKGLNAEIAVKNSYKRQG